MNKKVKEYLQKTAIYGGLIGGIVSGGMTLGCMSECGDAKTNVENLEKRIIQSDAAQTLVREQEMAVLEAYKKGVIDANEFTKQMANIHSGNFALDNRYKVTDKETAVAYEEADAHMWDVEGKMVGVAIGTGVSLGVMGLALVNRGHDLINEEKTTGTTDKDEVMGDDPNYCGA